MTKQDLTAAIDIQKKLTRFENRLSDLEATGGIRTSLGQTGRGGTKSSVSELASEMAEEIAELQRQLEAEQNHVRLLLENMQLTETERRLMLLHYVECLEWEDVAKRMAYSKPWVMKKRAEILKRIAEKSL